MLEASYEGLRQLQLKNHTNIGRHEVIAPVIGEERVVSGTRRVVQRSLVIDRSSLNRRCKWADETEDERETFVHVTHGKVMQFDNRRR
jgi:hypothetical protein